MIEYIEIILILVLIILVGLVLLNLKKKNEGDGDIYSKSDHEGFRDKIIEDINRRVDQVKTDLTTNLTSISTDAGTTKGVLETKSDQILKEHQRLLDSLTGSKRFGKTGELLLENLFRNSGLVYEKQWVKNLTIKKEGKSLTVEFAIKHPTGLYLPVDAHWPKTLYEKLLELRKVETTDEAERQRLEKEKDKLFKDIMTDFAEKAEDVNEKYIDNPISAGFACIYVPSESLYHEITTHINQKKILWISTVQEKTKVTFMGPSTFSAYCSAILLGFKQIEGDQKAKMFIKHLDALTHSIDKLNEETANHEKNVKKAYTDAQAVTSASEKMKSNMQRITEELENMGKDEK